MLVQVSELQFDSDVERPSDLDSYVNAASQSASA